MGFNKIPLALKFDDATGNANGLVEFRIDESQDLSGLPVSSLSGINLSSVPSDGQGLVFTNGVLSNAAVGGGGGGGLTSVNLGYNAAAASGQVTNDAGSAADLPAATGSDAGLLLPAEKAKLADIEPNADVTDTANVTTAGAVMDSEVTNLGFVKGLTGGISDGNVLTANDAVADDDFLRINGTEVEGLTVAETLTALSVESGADVTDATNVAAAGALMKSGGTMTGATTFEGVTIKTIEENSLMVTDPTSGVSSVSGPSGTIPYFTGTTPKPVLTGIPTIMEEADVRVEDKNLGNLKDTYSTSPGDGSILYRQGGVWTAQRIDIVQSAAGGGGGDDGGSPVKFDHGDLSGLGDDDHTQYVLSAGTRAMTSLTVNNNIATSGIFAKNIVPDPEDGLNIRAVNISGTTSVSSPNITGTDITARNNLNISGNLNATSSTLANAGITTTLHREVGAPVASSNSTSLAEVASYTLPANVLTLGDIDITVRGRQLAQGSNLRWNFKIGGTNILNSSFSQGTYSDMTAYSMDIQISKTATDKQLVTASFRQSTGSSSAAGRGSWSGIHRDGIIVNYDAAADESTALALSLEAQQSNAAQTVTVDHFIVRLIPDSYV